MLKKTFDYEEYFHTNVSFVRQLLYNSLDFKMHLGYLDNPVFRPANTSINSTDE